MGKKHRRRTSIDAWEGYTYADDHSMPYKQCVLTKLTPAGEMRTTSWVPALHAVVGKVLGLRKETPTTSSPQEWDEGWVVSSVSTNSISELQAISQSNEWAGWRDLDV